MMYTILLPIHPDHVKNIFNGTKRYEFRKRICKKPVDRILIYSTSPVMKVMGEAEIEDILVDTPEIIWERTKEKQELIRDSLSDITQAETRQSLIN